MSRGGRGCRQACKEYETRFRDRRRKYVEPYARAIKEGAQFPAPVFVDPSLSGNADGLFEMIDGARRVMAHAEAQTATVKVWIVSKASAIQTPFGQVARCGGG